MINLNIKNSKNYDFLAYIFHAWKFHALSWLWHKQNIGR